MSSAATPTPLVWLITGTSTGLGRLMAQQAIQRGDKVITTARARSLSKLDDLKALGAATLELDVNASSELINDFAKKAVDTYGRIDVLVNNAGYMLVGAVEENTPQEAFDQFNTNIFGALNLTRAILPYMRQRKSGTIIWFGSIGGYQPVLNCVLYCATKGALRTVSQGLHQEIAPLGLRSTCVDFGYFRTSFLNDDHRSPYEARIQDYAPMTAKLNDMFVAYNEKQPGDPVKGVQVLIDIVKGEGASQGKEWPATGVLLGSDCYQAVKTEYEGFLKSMEDWKDVTVSTDF